MMKRKGWRLGIIGGVVGLVLAVGSLSPVPAQDGDAPEEGFSHVRMAIQPTDGGPVAQGRIAPNPLPFRTAYGRLQVPWDRVWRLTRGSQAMPGMATTIESHLQTLLGGTPQARESAGEALREIGRPALPFLLAFLRDDGLPSTSRELAEAATRTIMAALNQDDDPAFADVLQTEVGTFLGFVETDELFLVSGLGALPIPAEAVRIAEPAVLDAEVPAADVTGEATLCCVPWRDPAHPIVTLPRPPREIAVTVTASDDKDDEVTYTGVVTFAYITVETVFGELNVPLSEMEGVAFGLAPNRFDQTQYTETVDRLYSSGEAVVADVMARLRRQGSRVVPLLAATLQEQRRRERIGYGRVLSAAAVAALTSLAEELAAEVDPTVPHWDRVSTIRGEIAGRADWNFIRVRTESGTEALPRERVRRIVITPSLTRCSYADWR